MARHIKRARDKGTSIGSARVLGKVSPGLCVQCGEFKQHTYISKVSGMNTCYACIKKGK